MDPLSDAELAVRVADMGAFAPCLAEAVAAKMNHSDAQLEAAFDTVAGLTVGSRPWKTAYSRMLGMWKGEAVC
jgi:hypothetical protein